MGREHCAHRFITTQWRRSLFLLTFVRDAPGSTGPAWRSKPAEVGLLLLLFFPCTLAVSVDQASIELDPKQVSGCFRVLLSSVFFVCGLGCRAGRRRASSHSSLPLTSPHLSLLCLRGSGHTTEGGLCGYPNSALRLQNYFLKKYFFTLWVLHILYHIIGFCIFYFVILFMFYYGVLPILFYIMGFAYFILWVLP